MARGDYEAMFKGTKRELTERRAYIARDAFDNHLFELGKRKHEGIDFICGISQLSISNYFTTAPSFTESRFQNPVNTAALTLLSDNLMAARDVSKAGRSTIEKAIRANKAAEWLVSTELGLHLPIPNVASTWVIRETAREASRTLDAGIVRELSEIATLVQERGYEDFLGYLVDARTELTDVVETIFEAGPQRRSA